MVYNLCAPCLHWMTLLSFFFYMHRRDSLDFEILHNSFYLKFLVATTRLYQREILNIISAYYWPFLKNFYKSTIMPSTKPRTQVARYPGVLTDWSGRFISPEIRNNITIGNIVRIPLIPHPKEELEFNVTMYFRLVKRCKKDSNCFVGVCEDPYNGNDPDFPVNNGDRRVFSTRQICEIPLDWDGNQNLKKVAKYRNIGRAITGAIF